MKFSAPKILLHLEGLAVLVVVCVAYSHLGYRWTWFAAAFLAPDLAMLGYIANPRIGAVCYNAAHTYLAPLILSAVFAALAPAGAQWLPLVWIAHIGFDRLLGYGLKYPTEFKATHLNKV